MLTQVAGGPVQLEDPRVIKSWARNDVLRARVAAGGGALPSSVIVKHFKADYERGFDDWAALEFLSRLASANAVAPRFLGGDPNAGLFVIEDLGAGETLEEVLNGDDSERAAEGLLDVARVTGRLHALTSSRHAAYDDLRAALAPRPLTARSQAAAFVRQRRKNVLEWLAVGGLAAEQPFLDAFERVAASVEDCGPLAVLTHGDMAPSNSYFAGGGLRLLDFEYAGVRHALYDTLFWILFCPFPPALIERADAAYRAELVVGCPAAADDATYRAGQGRVVAWRMLNLLQWLPPRLLEKDRAWAPDHSARQALLWHLERAGAALAATTELAALADAFAALHAFLRRRWRREEESMFVWPAFRGVPTLSRRRSG